MGHTRGTHPTRSDLYRVIHRDSRETLKASASSVTVAWPCSSANAVSSARRRLGKRTVEGELRDPHGDGAVLSTAMMAAVRRVPARRLLPLFSRDDFWGFTAPSAGSVHRIEMTQAPAPAAS